jgi:Large-conductance mechanosensitive channel, MscL
MIKGFRDFIMRGNVIDLAVAVIIGAAFTVIVTSFVTNVLTPLIASLVGKPDFSALILYINGGKINYGIFLNSVISFLLQAPVRQQRHRRREGADRRYTRGDRPAVLPRVCRSDQRGGRWSAGPGKDGGDYAAPRVDSGSAPAADLGRRPLKASGTPARPTDCPPAMAEGRSYRAGRATEFARNR